MNKKNNQEPISIEEYLLKRKQIKKEETKKKKTLQENNPTWMLAGLYG